MPKVEEYLLTDSVRKKVRKAFRAGEHTVEVNGRKFNVEQAPGKAGKPFIMITPIDGMTPMAQLEIKDYGSSKLKDDKGKPFIKSPARLDK